MTGKRESEKQVRLNNWLHEPVIAITKEAMEFKVDELEDMVIKLNAQLVVKMQERKVANLEIEELKLQLEKKEDLWKKAMDHLADT